MRRPNFNKTIALCCRCGARAYPLRFPCAAGIRRVHRPRHVAPPTARPHPSHILIHGDVRGQTGERIAETAGGCRREISGGSPGLEFNLEAGKTGWRSNSNDWANSDGSLIRQRTADVMKNRQDAKTARKSSVDVCLSQASQIGTGIRENSSRHGLLGLRTAASSVGLVKHDAVSKPLTGAAWSDQREGPGR